MADNSTTKVTKKIKKIIKKAVSKTAPKTTKAAKKTAKTVKKTVKKTTRATKKTAVGTVEVEQQAEEQVEEKSSQVVQEQPLTPLEVEKFHQQLLQLRRELLGDMSHMQEEVLENNQTASGELSSMPVHMADVGTDNYEQEFTLGLIEGERKILTEINLALSRFEEGTYGICEGTGQTISRARLEANPYARYCVEYARKIEQGLVKPENKNI